MKMFETFTSPPFKRDGRNGWYYQTCAKCLLLCWYLWTYGCRWYIPNIEEVDVYGSWTFYHCNSITFDIEIELLYSKISLWLLDSDVSYFIYLVAWKPWRNGMGWYFLGKTSYVLKRFQVAHLSSDNLTLY